MKPHDCREGNDSNYYCRNCGCHTRSDEEFGIIFVKLKIINTYEIEDISISENCDEELVRMALSS